MSIYFHEQNLKLDQHHQVTEKDDDDRQRRLPIRQETTMKFTQVDLRFIDNVARSNVFSYAESKDGARYYYR